MASLQCVFGKKNQTRGISGIYGDVRMYITRPAAAGEENSHSLLSFFIYKGTPDRLLHLSVCVVQS